MKQKFVDERTEQINGFVSFLCLMLTQLALAGVILYKRYFLNLPPEAYTEISWIVGISMASYWGLRLYLSGMMPVLSPKSLLLIYFGLVLLIVIPTYWIHGLPMAERWYEVLYPFLGVAVILGFYATVAYLGKRRLEQMGA